jgi:hypothetical protein
VQPCACRGRLGSSRRTRRPWCEEVVGSAAGTVRAAGRGGARGARLSAGGEREDGSVALVDCRGGSGRAGGGFGGAIEKPRYTPDRAQPRAGNGPGNSHFRATVPGNLPCQIRCICPILDVRNRPDPLEPDVDLRLSRPNLAGSRPVVGFRRGPEIVLFDVRDRLRACGVDHDADRVGPHTAAGLGRARQRGVVKGQRWISGSPRARIASWSGALLMGARRRRCSAGWRGRRGRWLAFVSGRRACRARVGCACPLCVG